MTVVYARACFLGVGIFFVLGSEMAIGGEDARAKVLSVMVGEHKKPVFGESGGDAYGRYLEQTRAWVGELDVEDCVFLLDRVKRAKDNHGLWREVWMRYGEVDTEAAMERAGGDAVMAWAGRERRYLVCWVLAGWGRADPAAAWGYYNRWWDVRGGHPLHFSRAVHDGVFEIFQAWVKVDEKAAFEALAEIWHEDFHAAATGYYWGLRADMDFGREGEKLRELFEGANGVAAMGWSHGPEGPREVLGLALASKWARVDADAAVQWWLGWDEVGLRSRGLRDSAEHIWWREEFWLGKLLLAWCGEFSEGDPDGVLVWLRAHPEWLERRAVMEQVVVGLARYRGEAVVLMVERGEVDGGIGEMMVERVISAGVRDGVEFVWGSL